jgi:hypothetical protein
MARQALPVVGRPERAVELVEDGRESVLWPRDRRRSLLFPCP